MVFLRFDPSIIRNGVAPNRRTPYPFFEKMAARRMHSCLAPCSNRPGRRPSLSAVGRVVGAKFPLIAFSDLLLDPAKAALIPTRGRRTTTRTKRPRTGPEKYPNLGHELAIPKLSENPARLMTTEEHKKNQGRNGWGRTGRGIAETHRTAMRLDDKCVLIAGVFSRDSEKSRDSGKTTSNRPGPCLSRLRRHGGNRIQAGKRQDRCRGDCHPNRQPL